MREKMKKMLFLMLFLLILGAASVSAQVRIGGNGQPQGAAVLDLNADNNATPTGNKGALALPRVSLASATANLNSTTPINGMLVYNTNTTLGAGVYYWNTNQWIKVLDGSFVEGDAIVGNEITDTIAGGGLTRSGSGTPTSPYKVGIKPNGIVNGMIADTAVSLPKILTSSADSGLFLVGNGSSVSSTGRLFDSSYSDTLQLRIKPPVPATWANTLDTTIRLTFTPRTYIRVNAPGTMRGDLCYMAVPSNLILVWASVDEVIFASLHGAPEARAERVVCFRAIY
ncbi:hypothetical protein FACS189446_2210 [Bacteroidia bacterium]|nr:hypothetical protein FACS189446_2210 [Bacteroidia bacterium]